MPPFIGATYDVSCGTVHCEKYSSSPNGYLEMLCSKYIGNLNSGEPDSIPSPIRLYSCPSNLNCPLCRAGDSQEGVANRLKHITIADSMQQIALIYVILQLYFILSRKFLTLLYKHRI